MDTAIANLETVARITTVDYNGEEQVIYFENRNMFDEE